MCSMARGDLALQEGTCLPLSSKALLQVPSKTGEGRGHLQGKIGLGPSPAFPCLPLSYKMTSSL